MSDRNFLFLENRNVIDYKLEFARIFEKKIANFRGICNDYNVFD